MPSALTPACLPDPFWTLIWSRFSRGKCPGTISTIIYLLRSSALWKSFYYIPGWLGWDYLLHNSMLWPIPYLLYSYIFRGLYLICCIALCCGLYFICCIALCYGLYLIWCIALCYGLYLICCIALCCGLFLICCIALWSMLWPIPYLL